MSKVICDVCGTSYPDTATQCPICGCVRTASAQSVVGSAGEKRETGDGYTYVKGGRFSKANVRKRNSASGVASTGVAHDGRMRSQNKSGADNKALVITAIVIFLLIIAVVLFITVKFLLSDHEGNDQDQNADKNPSVQQEDKTVPCTDIYFDLEEITLKQVGEKEKLVVTVNPDGCTDELGEVRSENIDVATAELKDNLVTITAVGPGETEITLTCGEFTAVCKVKCDFEQEKELVLPETIELNKKGAKKDIYPDNILRTDIEWSSDDKTVATVAYGTVTAVGEGTTTVRAKYKNQEVECVVTCRFTEDGEDSGNDQKDDILNGTGGVTEDGGSSGGSYELKNLLGGRNDDITLSVNESAPFELRDSNGNRVSGVTWTSSDPDCCTVTDGTITAKKTGEVTITATFGGQSYTCRVIVYG